MQKIINSSDCNGIINVEKLGANSFTFEAEMPEGAKVKGVRIIGNFVMNGEKVINPALEDLPGVVPVYHKNRNLDGITDVATVYLASSELISAVQNYEIQTFGIEVEIPCSCCGG